MKFKKILTTLSGFAMTLLLTVAGTARADFFQD